MLCSKVWQVLLSIALVAATAISAQDFRDSITFEQRLGGSGLDVANAVIELEDGSYAVAGYTSAGVENGIDVYVAKLDSMGLVLWANAYGQSGNDYGWDLMENDFGEIVVVGYTTSTTTGDEDVPVSYTHLTLPTKA